MQYGFFDSINVGTEQAPEYDRPVDADFFTRFFGAVQANGVSGFGVSAGSGLAVSVAEGIGVINGRMGYDTISTTLALGSGSSQRTYSICLRLSTSLRTISLVAVNGSPVRADDTYDLCLAQVAVPANASQITAAMITDTRSDAALCGLIDQASGADHTLYVQQAQPSSPVAGDLWFW